MTTQQGGRRADAVRNRERVVAAAAQAFAELGLDASMNEVARRAGVGIATTLRHFAHRDELVAAVFTDRMHRYAELIEAAAALPDAGEGVRQCLLDVCELQASDRGLTRVLAGTYPAAPEFEAERERAHRSFADLVRRAQEQGRLRADFVPADLPLLLMANAGVIDCTAGHAPDAWRRLVGYFMQALSAESAEPLDRPVKVSV
ncbi:TetR/AcrR family transcriptional regulator [Kineosporia sp. J2-2]|uniref:TetR/AcrR family transcriptional regulator n=1 Tax=Kineosporia corallincola TaxID=2835133 RepID=A0ABS5THU7_9ACTN|nr:TetR/AcrR family transcriptional regulator [Kineosporia corallincola]MBT0770620.1 TetR/AcrR family transcriptional regulator [Kineosporia corallincola]